MFVMRDRDSEKLRKIRNFLSHVLVFILPVCTVNPKPNKNKQDTKYAVTHSQEHELQMACPGDQFQTVSGPVCWPVAISTREHGGTCFISRSWLLYIFPACLFDRVVCTLHLGVLVVWAIASPIAAVYVVVCTSILVNSLAWHSRYFEFFFLSIKHATFLPPGLRPAFYVLFLMYYRADSTCCTAVSKEDFDFERYSQPRLTY